MRISPTDNAAHLGENFVSRNRLHVPRAHLIPATNGLRGPEFPNFGILGEVEALNEFLGQLGAGSGREVHGFFGKLIECKRHTAP